MILLSDIPRYFLAFSKIASDKELDEIASINNLERLKRFRQHKADSILKFRAEQDKFNLENKDNV